MPTALLFQEEMDGFCRRSTFKQYVRDAINDELFWKQIFNDMRISNQVDTALNNKVPERVRNYLSDYLPSKVTQEIMHQLPNIVNNNYQMQQLFQSHKEQLKIALDSATSTILAKIVNEDQYHEVNRAYFEAFNNRGETAIQRFNLSANNAVNNMREQCDHDLKRFHDELDHLQDLQIQVDKLKAEVSSLTTCFYFMGSMFVLFLAGGLMHVLAGDPHATISSGRRY